MCNWSIRSGSLLSAKLKHKEEGRELRGTWCCVMELVLWSTCFGRGHKHVLMPAGIRAIARRFSMTVSVGTYIVPSGYEEPGGLLHKSGHWGAEGE